MLSGKNAIVTGASRGIGKAIAEAFAEQGANVWVWVRGMNDELAAFFRLLEGKYSVRVIPIVADLTDKDAMQNAVKTIGAEKQPIDILVNNAGALPENRLFMMSSDEEMQRVFDVNFFAEMTLTRLIAKKMIRQKKGSIINIGSIAALDGEPAQIEYVASKAALLGATKKLASELGSFGIRVNAVAPGIVDTDMVKAMNETLKTKILDRVIMKRMAEPREIANAVAFLASDMASYITGQVLRVDGGM